MRLRNGCLYLIILGGLCTVSCIALALIYPQIVVWYAQLDDRRNHRICSNFPEDTEVLTQYSLPEIAVELPITPITVQNVSQLITITDIEPLEHFQLRRLGYNILQHRSEDYGIYLENPPSAGATLFFCDTEGNSLKTLFRDETTKVKFSPDYVLFAVYEARFGHIELYNAKTLELGEKIDVRKGTYTAVWSIAFHPTEPILAFTRNVREQNTHELYLWNIETNQLIDAFEFSEISENSLTFNAEGNLLYFTESEGGHVWGIPTDS